ncbi:hypothetical protein VTN00DRAFT_310 [Thermoascus crustaceus]|uniref:uncharacterized protein n=1 Tax=Thermoascus crustaceus TaxID=5088 RepID=UPI00374495E4
MGNYGVENVRLVLQLKHGRVSQYRTNHPSRAMVSRYFLPDGVDNLARLWLQGSMTEPHEPFPPSPSQGMRASTINLENRLENRFQEENRKGKKE